MCRQRESRGGRDDDAPPRELLLFQSLVLSQCSPRGKWNQSLFCSKRGGGKWMVGGRRHEGTTRPDSGAHGSVIYVTAHVLLVYGAWPFRPLAVQRGVSKGDHQRLGAANLMGWMGSLRLIASLYSSFPPLISVPFRSWVVEDTWSLVKSSVRCFSPSISESVILSPLSPPECACARTFVLSFVCRCRQWIRRRKKRGREKSARKKKLKKNPLRF